MTIKALVFWACAVSVFSCPAGAAMLGDQLPPGLNLSEEERAGLEPALAHYYAMEGAREELNGLLVKCAGCGCRQSCLSDVVSAVTKAMKAGMNSSAAVGIASEALDAASGWCTDRKIIAKPEDMGRAVVGRIELKVREREAKALPNKEAPGAR